MFENIIKYRYSGGVKLDAAIIAMLILSIILNVILLWKTSKRDMEEHIISEIKINLSQNNMNLIDSVNRKISDSEQKQLREILTNKLETVERMEKNTTRMTESFMNFSQTTSKSLNENFQSLTERVGTNLDKINMRVEERLSEGFEKTNKTFANILERLSKIDEAQKKIAAFHTNIVSLQDVLTDQERRGNIWRGSVKPYFVRCVRGEK